MLKSEEHNFEILVSQLNAEKRARRSAERQVRAAEQQSREDKALISSLLERISSLESLIESRDAKIDGMFQQIKAMLLGEGAISLSSSLKDELIGSIRETFERQKRELMEANEREKQALMEAFARKLAAKDNEISRLKGKEPKGGEGDSPSSSPPPSFPSSSGNPVPLTSAEQASRIKQLEQQKSNLQSTCYGQRTESGKCRHGAQQVEDADNLDLNGEDVPDERVVEIASNLKQRKNMKGVKKPRREQPLQDLIQSSDEIELRPDNLPDDAVEIASNDGSSATMPHYTA